MIPQSITLTITTQGQPHPHLWRIKKTINNLMGCLLLYVCFSLDSHVDFKMEFFHILKYKLFGINFFFFFSSPPDWRGCWSQWRKFENCSPRIQKYTLNHVKRDVSLFNCKLKLWYLQNFHLSLNHFSAFSFENFLNLNVQKFTYKLPIHPDTNTLF